MNWSAATGMRAMSIAVLFVMGAMPAPATAQVFLGIRMPSVGIDIGFHARSYPDLRLVPGYPVYYAPAMEANYFYYDGMFWIFQGDNWYSSNWYDGPWQLVGAGEVPDYILRVPVGYYVRPPVFFRGWQRDAPPRWGDHWGAGWTKHRGNWDRWDRRSSPAAAPPPSYQQRFSGEQYPRPEQQGELRRQQDRYQPRDPAVRRIMNAPQQQERTQDRPGPPPRAAPPPPSPPQQQHQQRSAAGPAQGREGEGRGEDRREDRR
jgi:hypothetical protein